jgi:hypothetical protein
MEFFWMWVPATHDILTNTMNTFTRRRADHDAKWEDQDQAMRGRVDHTPPDRYCQETIAAWRIRWRLYVAMHIT